MTEPGPNHFAGTLAAAFTFFTRLPRPPWPAYRESHERHAAALGAWVGLVVGAISALAAWLGWWLLGPLTGAIAAIIAAVWVTGALHEDGFADFCDGFGHLHDREQTLAIMRDPRTGTYAVVGLVCLLGLRLSALLALFGAVNVLQVGLCLIAAAALSRASAVSIMQSLPYARADDDTARGRKLSRPLPMVWAALSWAGALVGLLLAAAWVEPWAAAALPAILLLRIWLLSVFQTRLGGYTGDCLGAVQQLSDLLALLIFAVVVTH